MTERQHIIFDYYVGTVNFFRSVAPAFGVRTWRSAAKRFAAQYGRATVLLANDGAWIVTRLPDGRLSTKLYAPHEVRWIGLNGINGLLPKTGETA